MANLDILSHRYVTALINSLFSEQGINLSEREFWITVMNTQREAGVDIPLKDIEKFETVKDDINFALIEKIEKLKRHDIKAKIEAFIETAGAGQHLHKMLTSRDLTDNVEQSLIKKAAIIIFGKFVSVLRHLLDKADEYRYTTITARSHHQAAQPTLLGRRFSMWAEELLYPLLAFENFIKNYPLRGIKGPVGTQADMLELLGTTKKVDALELAVAEHLGFEKILHSPGQVYPRSFDYALLSQLSLLAGACESFAKTMRLMAGLELVTEGFKEGQVGSTAMPHKQNTRTSERICGLANLLKMYVFGASLLSGDQWEEGDVSCSVVRRVIIPGAFYTADGLCEAILTVLNEMGAYPIIINKEIDRYLPFLATSQIINLAMSHGIGRENAHEIIEEKAISVALKMKEEGLEKNNLAELLAKDQVFKQHGITKETINNVLTNRARFIGNAEKQINSVIKDAKKLLNKYPKEAKYEPEEIL